MERHLKDASSADPAQGAHAAAFVALALDHAYQAFESMLVRVEQGLGLSPRTGSTWHREILADAATSIAALRPAIVPLAALASWEALLAFRHFLRHAYSVELDAARLRQATAQLCRAVEATAPSVASLLGALEAAGDTA